MAITQFTTADGLKKKAWEEKLFRDVRKESYFEKFMGTDPNSIIQVKTHLEKAKGDEVVFGLIPRITGSGVTSGQTLEGNEVALTSYNFSVVLERYRQAVRHDYISDKRVIFSISDEARSALQVWGSEKIDQLNFNALTASPTRVFYSTDGVTMTTTATAATAKGALTTSSLITTKQIDFAKAWATTGGNRSQTPLRPVKVGGKNYLVLLVHPDVAYDLKNDATYNQAQREAQGRGDENPIFTGALGIWNGVVVHEHENIPIATDAGVGANVPWAQCLLMGAQAGVWAWGERPSLVTKEFDYQEETGQAWRMTAKAGKTKFNSKDFGVFSFYVARSQVSDL